MMQTSWPAGMGPSGRSSALPRATPATEEQKLIEVLQHASTAKLGSLLACVPGWQLEAQANLENWEPVLSNFGKALNGILTTHPRVLAVRDAELEKVRKNGSQQDKEDVEEVKEETKQDTDDEQEEQQATRTVYEILRFSAFLLENAANKNVFASTTLNPVVELLGARNEFVAQEAARVIAMQTLPPQVHRFAVDPSSLLLLDLEYPAKLKERLLQLADTITPLNSSQSISEFLQSSSSSEGSLLSSQFTYSNDVNSTRVISIPSPDHAQGSPNTGIFAPSASKAGDVCDSLIKDHDIPSEFHFKLYLQVRTLYAVEASRASRERALIERLQALTALFYIFSIGAQGHQVTSLLERNPELIRGVAELIRAESIDKISLRVRVAASQALTALVCDRSGRGGSRGVLGRHSAVMQALGIVKGMPHGIFPALVRFALGELGEVVSKSSQRRTSVTSNHASTPGEQQSNAPEVDADMDMSLAVAFVHATTSDNVSPEEAEIMQMPAFRDVVGNAQDAQLYWIETVLTLLSAVVGIQSGATIMTENGVIPALLNAINTPSVGAYHATVISLCVQILENTVSTHSTPANLYRDLNGVGVLTDRLMLECADVPSNGQPLPISRTVLQVSLLAALSVSFHSQGVMSAGATSRVIREGSVLSKVLTQIVSNVDTFGPVVFAQAAIVVSDVINNDPSSVHQVHGSGIADALLRTITRWDVKDLYPTHALRPPCAELIMSLPSVINALSLTTVHAEKVATYSPLVHVLDMFALPEYASDESCDCFKGDVPAIVGTGLYELMRAVSGAQAPAVQATVQALKKIVQFGEETKGQENKFRVLVRMVTNLSELLEPIISKSEHATIFADHGGVSSLMKLYELLLPSTSSFLADKSSTQEPSGQRRATNALNLALKAYAGQQPIAMLTTCVKEMDVQLNALQETRKKVDVPEANGDSKEGAEGTLSLLSEEELSQLFGNKTLADQPVTSRTKVVGDFLQRLAMLEWLSSLLVSIMSSAQSHLQSRRWFAEFAARSTQDVLARLFALDRSVQLERARLAANYRKQEPKGESEETDPIMGLYKVASLMLLRFVMVMRSLLAGCGRSFVTTPMQHHRGEENQVPLPAQTMTLARAITNVFRKHLQYVNDASTGDIQPFVRQFYLTYLLETIVNVVFEMRSKHVNTVLLVELLKPVKKEHLDEEEAIEEFEQPCLLDMITRIMNELFASCLDSAKHEEIPEKMRFASFRVAAGALRKFSDLEAMSASPLTSALVANEESGVAVMDGEGPFEPKKFSFQLRAHCLHIFLPLWQHEKLPTLPVETCILEVLRVAITLLKNRLDSRDALDASGSSLGLGSSFGFGNHRPGTRPNRDVTSDMTGNDSETRLLQFALFGRSDGRARRESGSRQSFVPDPSVVEGLTAMGFDRASVDRALRRIQLNDVEVATEYMLAHPEGPDAAEEEEGKEEDSTQETQVADEDDAQEQELREKYNELRGSFETVCFKLVLEQANALEKESKNETDEATLQYLVKVVAEYLQFLCSNGDDERGVVVERTAGQLKTLLQQSDATDAQISVVTHLVAVLLHTDATSRSSFQNQTTECINQLLAYATSKASSGEVKQSHAPTLLLLDMLVIGDVKPSAGLPVATDSSDEKDSDSCKRFRTQTLDLSLQLLDLLPAQASSVDAKQVAHSLWQILVDLLSDYEVATMFIQRHGVTKVLNLDSSMVFSGYNDLTRSLLARALESPEVLQQSMEQKILRAVSKLSTRFGTADRVGCNPRGLLMELAPTMARNENVFTKALQESVDVKKSESGRSYVVVKSKSHSNEDGKKTGVKITKEAKHAGKMVLRQLISKIHALWQVEQKVSDDNSSEDEKTNESVCLGTYLGFLEHLVAEYPMCAKLVAKAKDDPHSSSSDLFVRVVIRDLLPSTTLCRSANRRHEDPDTATEAKSTSIARHARLRVRNAHKMLTGISSHSGESSKVAMAELVKLLQEWPRSVSTELESDAAMSVRDEKALSALHAWTGMAMSILWPRGTSKNVSLDKTSAVASLTQRRHAFLNILADALRKVDLDSPLAHATCTMVLRPLATLGRHFVTDHIKKVLLKRGESGIEDDARAANDARDQDMESPLPEAEPRLVYQDSWDPSEMEESSGDVIEAVVTIDDDEDDNMQHVDDLHDDDVELEEQPSDDEDNASSGEEEIVLHEDPEFDEDEMREEDLEEDDDLDDDDDEDDDEDDDGEDEDDENEFEMEDSDDESIHIVQRLVRGNYDGAPSSRHRPPPRLGVLDTELAASDALDEVDENEYSYAHMTAGEEFSTRGRRQDGQQNPLWTRLQGMDSRRATPHTVRSLLDSLHLRDSGVGVQANIIDMSEDAMEEDLAFEFIEDAMPDAAFLGGASGTSVRGGMRDAPLGVMMQDMQDMHASLFDIPGRSRGGNNQVRNTNAISMSDLDGPSTHPLLLSSGASNPSDAWRSQTPTQTGLPARSLRTLHGTTERGHVESNRLGRNEMGMPSLRNQMSESRGLTRNTSRPPSRSQNRLLTLTDLLSDFAVDLPTPHDAIGSDFTLTRNARNPVERSATIGRMGEQGPWNSASGWGRPGSQRERDLRAVVSRVEGQLDAIFPDASQPTPTASTRQEGTGEADAEEPTQEETARPSTTGQEESIEEESTPVADTTMASEVASETASVSALTSTLNESSLRSPRAEAHPSEEQEEGEEQRSTMPPPAPQLDAGHSSSSQGISSTEAEPVAPMEDAEQRQESTSDTEGGLVCPDGVDQDVFDSLPPEVQAEIIAQNAPEESRNQSNDATEEPQAEESENTGNMTQLELDLANTSFDRETLDALPPDIREEVLANERREREAAAATTETPADPSHAQEMDSASFVASLTPDLREEILTTCDDAFLQSLPSSVRAEAMILRERSAFRSAMGDWRSGEGQQTHRSANEPRDASETWRRMNAGRRQGRHGTPSSTSSRRGQRLHDNENVAAGMLRVDKEQEEDANDRMLSDDAVKALVRLVFSSSNFFQTRTLQRVLGNACSYPLTRKCVRETLLRALTMPLEEPLELVDKESDEFPPTRMFGEGRGGGSFDKTNVPSILIVRVLLLLVTLSKFSPRFALELLQSHKMKRGGEVVMDESSAAPILELMRLPFIERTKANLEAALELLDTVLSPLNRLKAKQKEESEDTTQNVLPVPTIELGAVHIDTLVRMLCLDMCSGAMQERTLNILRLLDNVPAHRSLILDALVHHASEIAALANEKPAPQSNFAVSAVLPSAQDELKLLRLLHALSDMCDSSAEFNECCSSIGLEPIWDTLSASLAQARASEGLDVDSKSSGVEEQKEETGANAGIMIQGKGAGASSLMASLLARFLPMVEAFFVANAWDASAMSMKVPDSSQREEATVAALRMQGLENQEGEPTGHPELRKDSRGSRMTSSMISESGESIRLVHFVEVNRELLNTLVRERPSLLDSSLSALIKLPRCRAYLDFDNKRSYFQSAMKKLRHHAQRHHGGASVRLSVRREHIFEDSFYALRMRNGNELRRKLHVAFSGEEGIDAGGVTREWYVILAREIFNPNYVLFTSAADSPAFQPNPLSYVNKDHLSYFEFVGKVIGKAVADGQLLDAHFTRSFYKHILQLPISYHDMEAIDPEYYRNLHSILDNSIEDLGLELTFSAEQSNFGRVEIVDLIPNGRSIPVTDDNKMEYVQLITHHRMATGIQQQIDSFLKGFHQLVPPELISIFNENELELLISGMPEIDIDDLKANTEYSNYKPTDNVIRWFWNVLYACSHEERALFLQFVTGTSKVPLEGFKALEGMRGTQKFNIHKAFGNVNALPSAHTCFNQLDLPEYESEERLKQRLLFAIREGSEGFGFG